MFAWLSHVTVERALTPLDETLIAWQRKTRDQQYAAFQSAMRETREERTLASPPYLVGLVLSGVGDAILLFEDAEPIVKGLEALVMQDPNKSWEEKMRSVDQLEQAFSMNEKYEEFMRMLTDYWQEHQLTPDETVRNPKIVARMIREAYGSLDEYARLNTMGFTGVEGVFDKIRALGTSENIFGWHVILEARLREYSSGENVFASRSGPLMKRFIEELSLFGKAFVRAWRGEVEREVEAYRRVLQGEA